MLADASTLPPQDGQAADSTSTDTRTLDRPQADAASVTTDKPASTNLHDDPNFRKLQSSYEKRLADQAKLISDLQAKQEEIALADMDDVDRLKYERDKFARQLEEREQAAAIEQQRRTILTEIRDEFGVPLEVIEAADSAYEAQRLALQYLKRNGPERREASKVDLGGGRANTPADRYETAARDAFQTGDAAAYIRALREAQPGG